MNEVIQLGDQKFVYDSSKGWIDSKTKIPVDEKFAKTLSKITPPMEGGSFGKFGASSGGSLTSKIKIDKKIEPVAIGDTKYVYSDKGWIDSKTKIPASPKLQDVITSVIKNPKEEFSKNVDPTSAFGSFGVQPKKKKETTSNTKVTKIIKKKLITIVGLLNLIDTNLPQALGNKINANNLFLEKDEITEKPHAKAYKEESSSLPLMLLAIPLIKPVVDLVKDLAEKVVSISEHISLFNGLIGDIFKWFLAPLTNGIKAIKYFTGIEDQSSQSYVIRNTIPDPIHSPMPQLPPGTRVHNTKTGETSETPNQQDSQANRVNTPTVRVPIPKTADGPMPQLPPGTNVHSANNTNGAIGRMIGSTPSANRRNSGDFVSRYEYARNRNQQANSALTRNSNTSSSDGKLIDNVNKTFILNGGITGNNRNLQNLNPELESAMVKALAEYHQRTGRKARMTSGYRYPGDQARISSGKNPKAAPGHSLHERGNAIDFNSEDIRKMNELGILEKYGLMGGRASSRRGGTIVDKVHIELKDRTRQITPQNQIGMNAPIPKEGIDQSGTGEASTIPPVPDAMSMVRSVKKWLNDIGSDNKTRHLDIKENARINSSAIKKLTDAATALQNQKVEARSPITRSTKLLTPQQTKANMAHQTTYQPSSDTQNVISQYLSYFRLVESKIV